MGTWLNQYPRHWINLLNCKSFYWGMFIKSLWKCANIRKLWDKELKVVLIHRKNKIKKLPEGVPGSSHKDLTLFHISSNELEALPSSITKCTSLEIIYANANKIISVPTDFASLKALTHCNFSSNRIEVLDDSFVERFGSPDANAVCSKVCAQCFDEERCILVQYFQNDFSNSNFFNRIQMCQLDSNATQFFLQRCAIYLKQVMAMTWIFPKHEVWFARGVNIITRLCYSVTIVYKIHRICFVGISFWLRLNVFGYFIDEVEQILFFLCLYRSCTGASSCICVKWTYRWSLLP